MQDIREQQAAIDRRAEIIRELCTDVPITEGSPKQIGWADDIRWRKAETVAMIIWKIENNPMENKEDAVQQQKIIQYLNKTFGNPADWIMKHRTACF